MSRVFFKVNDKNLERVEYTIIDDCEASCVSELLSACFDKYEVPEEFRVIFFYKSLINNDVKEFMTNAPLIYMNHSVKGDYYKKNTNNQGQLFYYVMNSIKNCSKEAVYNFFKKLDENHLLDKYLHAISDYFFLRIDSYSLDIVSNTFDSINIKRKKVKRLIKTIKKD